MADTGLKKCVTLIRLDWQGITGDLRCLILSFTAAMSGRQLNTALYSQLKEAVFRPGLADACYGLGAHTHHG